MAIFVPLTSCVKSWYVTYHNISWIPIAESGLSYHWKTRGNPEVILLKIKEKKKKRKKRPALKQNDWHDTAQTWRCNMKKSPVTPLIPRIRRRIGRREKRSPVCPRMHHNLVDKTLPGAPLFKNPVSAPGIRPPLM